VTANEFCRRAEELIGRPYSEIDCIGVVRIAANIRCQGTNWLWRSYENSGKYRYLIERMERPPLKRETRNGLLVFRVNWNFIPSGYNDKPNCYHVGIISGENVIQSQEKQGVNIKPYNYEEWDACGWLKQITPDTVTDEPNYDTETDMQLEEKIDRIYMMVKELYNRYTPVD